MKYEVVLQRHARRDIWETHTWIAKQAPLSADQWIDRLQSKIRTLQESPDRCPLVTERHRLSFDVRELLQGRKPYVFRTVFVIDGSSVRVLRVRRAQRRRLSAKELEDAVLDNEPLADE